MVYIGRGKEGFTGIYRNSLKGLEGCDLYIGREEEGFCKRLCERYGLLGEDYRRLWERRWNDLKECKIWVWLAGKDIE